MSTVPPNLPEERFIRDEYPKSPYPLWFWLFCFVAGAILVASGIAAYANFMKGKSGTSPFMQVTNRDFSLFLWQNPEYMRVYSKNKEEYLPGFQYEHKVSLNLDFADNYVAASPEVIFLYHTWKRLISREFPQRSISLKEFQEFLAYAEEWLPKNWPQAPAGYVLLTDAIAKGKDKVGDTKINAENLQQLAEEFLPWQVRSAFQGWKDYFREGDFIDTVAPTNKEMQEFLQSFPHYARNYWRNIVPTYLKSYTFEKFDPNAIVPKNEMAPFLKAAVFNALQKQGP